MTSPANTLRILRYAALVGIEDFRTQYTLRTWTFGWMLRIVAQTVFFTLIGKLLASPERLHYLLIGNAVMVACNCAIFVVASTTWERSSGTLPLLVAAPASMLTVFMGRSVEWIPDGLATSLAAFFIVGTLFGLPMPWPRVLWLVPLILLVTATTYMFGTFLGALVLRAMETRNLVSNVAYLTMMAVCGVNVPVSFYPEWIQRAAGFLPLTHGLQAIRDLLAGAPPPDVLANVAAEGVVGLGWMLLALVSFRWLAEGGRKDGSIEFAD
jgi:ABC-2 type transport system permease protein